MKAATARLLLATVLPALFILAGLGMYRYTASFVRGAARAEGRITAVRRTTKGTTIPTFSFADAAGVSHTQTLSFASCAFAYKPGDKVKVFYDGDAPEHAMIDSFATLWLRPVILTAIGLSIGWFLGILVATLYWRDARRARMGR